VKNTILVLLTASFLAGISVFFLYAADPLSGTWTGDWGPTPTHRNQVSVELKWDGKNLTGTVNPGPNAVEIKKATFDSQTNAIHFEADAASRRGGTFHYTIDGKVEGNNMSGSWGHDNSKGDFKLTKK
jgi:hypothetical protein